MILPLTSYRRTFGCTVFHASCLIILVAISFVEGRALLRCLVYVQSCVLGPISTFIEAGGMPRLVIEEAIDKGSIVFHTGLEQSIACKVPHTEEPTYIAPSSRTMWKTMPSFVVWTQLNFFTLTPFGMSRWEITYSQQSGPQQRQTAWWQSWVPGDYPFTTRWMAIIDLDVLFLWSKDDLLFELRGSLGEFPGSKSNAWQKVRKEIAWAGWLQQITNAKFRSCFWKWLAALKQHAGYYLFWDADIITPARETLTCSRKASLSRDVACLSSIIISQPHRVSIDVALNTKTRERPTIYAWICIA